MSEPIPKKVRVRWMYAILPVLIATAALNLYLCTLAPTVGFVDSGELIVAAKLLGNAHPPGFPLYLLLAHLATFLPFDTVAYRVNLASAIFAAAAAGMVAAALRELLHRSLVAPVMTFTRKGGKKKGRKVQDAETGTDETESNPFIPLLCGMSTAGALLAVSRTHWGFASIAEVYTLNTLLIVLILFLAFRWRNRLGRDDVSGFRRDLPLFGATLLFGLALGVHHVTVALTLPAFAVFAGRSAGWSFFRTRRFLIATAAALAGLLVYLYLPWAAAGEPLLNWGDPLTVERLWWHVTAKQYRSFLSFSIASAGEQFPYFWKCLLREHGYPFVPVALLSAIFGLVQLWRRDRSAALFFLVLVGANLGYALSYDIAEDQEAYYLPTFIVTALLAGVGVFFLLSMLTTRRWRIVAVIALLALAGAAFFRNLPFNDKSGFHAAADYGNSILNALPPSALLLTFDWQVYAPVLYLTEMEEKRRDVTVVDLNLLRRSWYFALLKKRYPDFYALHRSEVDLFLADLGAWESDPEFATNPVLINRLDDRFHAMIRSFVTRQMEFGDVYLTSEVLSSEAAEGPKFPDWLTSNFWFVPRGLVLEVTTDRSFKDPGPWKLELRGITDGGMKFEPEDVVRAKIIPACRTMAIFRGRYFTVFGRHREAAEAYRLALDLDPGFAPAMAAMEESRRLAGESSAIQSPGRMETD